VLRQRQDIRDGAFGKALHFAVLGDYESALDSLEAGFAAGDPFSSSIGYVKMYDPIRNDPRFQAMLKAVNLLP
jgi:hypothetical protein